MCNMVTYLKLYSYVHAFLTFWAFVSIPGAHMGIIRSLLPQNIGNLSLTFFGGKFPIVLLDNIY